MEIVIGREGNQPFRITEMSVGRKHAKLTVLADGQLQLEDLESKSGTYIIPPGGQKRKVIKTIITPDTRLFLGETYEVDMKQVLQGYTEKQRQEAERIRLEAEKRAKEEEVIREFEQLKTVYEQYSEKKIAMQRDSNMKNFSRTIPSIAMSAVFMLSFALGNAPWLTALKIVLGVLVFVFIGYTALQARRSQHDMPAKMAALNDQFMIDYTCPACGTFLGFIPFEAAKKKKNCPACKAKWTREEASSSIKDSDPSKTR
jgi:rubrerythrin